MTDLGPGARRARSAILRGIVVTVLAVTVGIGLPVPAVGSLLGPVPVAAADPTQPPDPAPTPEPTPEPTAAPDPTEPPTPEPTAAPTPTPNPDPTAAPSGDPTPTLEPTPVPSDQPTPVPSDQPTPEPTATPTDPGNPSPSPSPREGATPDNVAEPGELPSPSPGPTPEPTPEPGPRSAIVPGSVGRSSLAIEATYEVDLRLWLTTRSLSADETIEIVNRSGGPIDRLELNTVMARIGRLWIAAASVDGQAVTPTVSDQTIILPLGGILPDGAGATVQLAFGGAFSSATSGSSWLFTSAGGALAAYRWLPWVSARRPFDRRNHGDPFVTVSSPSVRLQVTTDRAARIATSARLVSQAGNVQVFAAENVRDITFVADPTFAVSAGWAGPTRVLVYGHNSTRRRLLLSEAIRALERAGRLLGPYPWPTFTVIETAGGYAMESPGAIWIPRGAGTYRFRYLVMHETTHQWFYGLVGSDQALQPFADEAPTDFITRYVNGQLRGSLCSPMTLDRSIYGYGACYYEVVYVQGANLLNSVRLRMGSALFWQGIRAYVADHRFGLGSTPSLLAYLDARTERNLARELASRFPSLRIL
jgi:hypothetical protein